LLKLHSSNAQSSIVYEPTELSFSDFISLEPNKEEKSDIRDGVMDAYLDILSRFYLDIQFIPCFILQIFLNQKTLYEEYNFNWPLSSLRYIFVPISMNLGAHWGLAVVQLQKKNIIFMDSENQNRKLGSKMDALMIDFYFKLT
jgi:hypothetical protein